ncbi:MAG: hypothetical protein MJZ56_06500 [Bacteroidales bacterium]|nr:hypothetical protein [Bacteroidales bacterium]
MKKLVLSVTAIAIICVVAMTACKKGEMLSPATNDVPTSNVVNNNTSIQRILKFKNQVKYYRENPNVKDGEKMSFEEAVWCMENLFNATYTTPTELCDKMADNEFLLNINTDADGNILMSDVTAIYDNIISEARNVYVNDGFDDKVFISLKVEPAESKGSSSVKVVATTGNRTTQPEHPYVMDGPFSDEQIDYRYDYGTCENPDDGLGAGGMWAFYINEYLNNGNGKPQSGNRYVYINRAEITFPGKYYPGLFYRTNIYDVCIDWEDMNMYYQNIRGIICNTIPNEAEYLGLTPTVIIITPIIDQIGDGAITHSYKVTYSEPVGVSIDEIGEVEDILQQ